jgi:hypothetical protein
MAKESTLLLRSASRYLHRDFNDDWVARQWLENLKGEVEVLGWRAERHPSSVWIVSFTARHRGEVVGFYYEVQLPSRLIRLVTGDDELEAKYAVPGNVEAKQWLLYFSGKAPNPYIKAENR